MTKPVRTLTAGRSSVLVLYHYLYPDDVVSAIHFTDLCTGLAAKGWKVAGSACNRSCRDEHCTYPKSSKWNDVEFERIWRPHWNQASTVGRLANTFWMISAWSLLAVRTRTAPDVLIVGTDPVLSPLVSLVWKIFRPRTRLVHWCFDLYPEAAVAAGVLKKGSLVLRLCENIIGAAYRKFNLIVDIGSCMRERLRYYQSNGATETIPPWALVEPSRPASIAEAERQELFGRADLCLLYSGNFGLAHTWNGILEIARELENTNGRVVFSVRGNAVEKLRRAVNESQTPIRFVEFASTQVLDRRLSAADVHIVSLREEWTGTVVPSKFFGALAIGRPVLFVGRQDSAIAKWILQLNVGWVLNAGNVEAVAAELSEWSRSPEAKLRLFQHCHDVYEREFSRLKALDRWDEALCSILD